MTQSLNEVLDRLHGALEGHRRFASDASHELRTPITAMAGEIDVTLMRPRTAQEYRDTLEVVRERLSSADGALRRPHAPRPRPGGRAGCGTARSAAAAATAAERHTACQCGGGPGYPHRGARSAGPRRVRRSEVAGESAGQRPRQRRVLQPGCRPDRDLRRRRRSFGCGGGRYGRHHRAAIRDRVSRPTSSNASLTGSIGWTSRAPLARVGAVSGWRSAARCWPCSADRFVSPPPHAKAPRSRSGCRDASPPRAVISEPLVDPTAAFERNLECPQDCPCDAPKRRLQSQQQPSDSIEEVIETRGFARKNEDGRDADRRLANRFTRLSGSLRFGGSSSSVGSIWDKSGPPSTSRLF